MENEKVNKTSEPNIGEVLSDFVSYLTCLAATLPLTMRAVTNAFKISVGVMEKFSRKNITEEFDEESAKPIIRVNNLAEFKKIAKQLRNFGLATEMVPQSLVVTLVSQYDAFLGNLLKAIIFIKPEFINSSEKSFTLAQLIDIGSIEDAKEFIIEKEVESVLRKSHAEQFQWMENKFAMTLRKDLSVWPKFIELTERRNLFVHTGGLVSSQYIKTCTENGVSWKEEIKVGAKLDVSQVYFQESINIVYEIGVKLAQVLWRKFKPEDLEEADSNLLRVAFEPLQEENYELAKTLFNFATTTLKRHSNEGMRKIFVVNRALAYKWSGGEKRAREIITEVDWSDTRDKFRLAEAIILENYPKAFQIIRDIGKNDQEFSATAYRTWPLFKVLRTMPEFILEFEEIFGEPFNKGEPEDYKNTGKRYSAEEIGGEDTVSDAEDTVS